MKRVHPRRAVTLAEMLIMTFIGLVVMGFAYNLLRRSGYIADSTSHSVELQVGVRNLLEHMARDVASCQQILAPTGDPKHSLIVAKYAGDSVETRLTKNTNKAFPFVHTDNSGAVVTQQKLDVLRVGYVWDSGKRTVSRIEERGELVAESESAPALLTRFTFNQSALVSNQVLATSVENFSIYYVGYDPVTGEPRMVAAAGDPSPLGYEKTAAVAVRVKAQFEEGVYRDDHSRPRIEIFTKIWSLKRRSDEMYKEYFSSTDEDLRW